MFKSITEFFKRFKKSEKEESKSTAKERLHLVLAQDRANISADFLEMMKQEIIEVIKKYIEVDEGAIDVRLTNKANDDGTTGAPALYANIPIMNIKHEMGKEQNEKENESKKELPEEKQEEIKQEPENENKNESDNKEENTDKEVEETNNKVSSDQEKVEEKAEESQKQEETKSEKEPEKKEEIPVTNK